MKTLFYGFSYSLIKKFTVVFSMKSKITEIIKKICLFCMTYGKIPSIVKLLFLPRDR